MPITIKIINFIFLFRIRFYKMFVLVSAKLQKEYVTDNFLLYHKILHKFYIPFYILCGSSGCEMGEDVEGSEGTEGLVVTGVVVEDGVEDAGAGVAVEGDQGEAAGVAGHKYAG